MAIGELTDTQWGRMIDRAAVELHAYIDGQRGPWTPDEVRTEAERILRVAIEGASDEPA